MRRRIASALRCTETRGLRSICERGDVRAPRPVATGHRPHARRCTGGTQRRGLQKNGAARGAVAPRHGLGIAALLPASRLGLLRVMGRQRRRI